VEYSVSLWLGEAAEAQIRGIWARLAEAGIGTFAGGLVRPHVTLAHGLELDPNPFVAALRERLSSYPRFDLVFSGLGLFTEPNVLYLSTRMSEPLWTLHREVYALSVAHGARPSLYYLPDTWTPHCTLALGLTWEEVLRAIGACQGLSFPLRAAATRVGVVENPGEAERLALPLAVLE
jgi:2'-5' RNA ligase